MATKIWLNFVQMIHFKLNFMLILGHPERQRGCNESAPGVWGKCYRRRRGCPELPQNLTGPVGDSTLAQVEQFYVFKVSFHDIPSKVT